MSITRFVTADGLPAFLAHLSKSARVLAPVEKPGNKTAVVFEPWKEGKPFTLAKATVPAKEAVLPQCAKCWCATARPRIPMIRANAP